MITVTFDSSDKNEEMTFSVEPTLLQAANATLAKAIVDSLDTENAEFSHFFDQEKYSVYSWDLSDDESNARFINASIEAERMARKEDNLKNYKSYLTECLDSVLTSMSCTDYDANYFYDNIINGELAFLASDIVEALAEIDGVDSTIENGSFEEMLKETMIEKLAKNDDSELTDLLGNRKVEFVYSKGFDWENGYYSERHTSHDSNCSSLDTIIVDESLQLLFDMANVSKKAWLDYLTSKEVDKEVIERFNELEDNADSNKPQILSCDSIVEVMENASYGGTPMLTAFVCAKEFIKRDITKGYFLTGGVIGLEDLVNGSGHNESIESPIFVTPEDFAAVKANYGKGYDVRDNVYGYYRPALYSDIKQEDEVQPSLAA